MSEFSDVMTYIPLHTHTHIPSPLHCISLFFIFMTRYAEQHNAVVKHRTRTHTSVGDDCRGHDDAESSLCLSQLCASLSCECVSGSQHQNLSVSSCICIFHLLFHTHGHQLDITRSDIIHICCSFMIFV